MLPAKQDVITMIDLLPEQQLQQIVNYIVLLKNENNHNINAQNKGFIKTPKLYHDLDVLAGTWSDEEAQEFLNAIADFNQVDEKLWQ